MMHFKSVAGRAGALPSHTQSPVALQGLDWCTASSDHIGAVLFHYATFATRYLNATPLFFFRVSVVSRTMVVHGTAELSPAVPLNTMPWNGMLGASFGPGRAWRHNTVHGTVCSSAALVVRLLPTVRLGGLAGKSVPYYLSGPRPG